MFVLGGTYGDDYIGDDERAWFFEGYGKVFVDPDLLAYWRGAPRAVRCRVPGGGGVHAGRLRQRVAGRSGASARGKSRTRRDHLARARLIGCAPSRSRVTIGG